MGEYADMHAAIMNMDPPEGPSDFGDWFDEELDAAYKRGFRDARHAAAELVYAQPEPAAPAEQDWSEPELWAEIYRLRAAVKGPDGFDSWQDAATDERIRRVRAERALAAPSVAPEPVAWRYQDVRGHYRYRAYNPGFDVEYAILKPVPLYAAHPPRAPSVAPEPVAWMWRNKITGAKGVYFEDPERFFNIAAKGEYEWTQLFTHPPRAPLTDAEIDRLDTQAIHGGPDSQYAFRFARLIEAAHGISAAAIGADGGRGKA